MFAASLRSMPMRLSGNVCRTGCRGAPCTHSRTLINTQAQALTWESEEPFIFKLCYVPLWRVLSLELFVSNPSVRWCFTEVTLHKHVKCSASSSYPLFTCPSPRSLGLAFFNYYSRTLLALKLVVSLVDGFF